MNKVLVFSTVISATLVILSACSKDDASQQPLLTDEFYTVNGESLQLSDTVIKRGQTVAAGFGYNSDWKGDWTVGPNDGVKIFGEDKLVRILFTQPGLYTITAKAKTGSQAFTGTVRVIDSPYIPAVVRNPVDLAADDIITLQPMSFRDDVLVFHASGKIGYSCLTTLLYQNSSTSGEIKVDFTGTPGTATALCLPGPYAPPSSFVYTRGYANGMHNITIRLGKNLTTYTGTFTVTDDKITFNWPDNIPVVIAPKEIARAK
jgi:hypothetical protein